MKSGQLKQAILQTLKNFRQFLPVLFGVMMLISLVTALIPDNFYKTFFSGNNIIDSFLAALIGSISAGNPAMSYVIGGELILQNVSLIAITAFLITWVTVGLVQMPAEGLMLGRRFTIIRNIISFITAIIVSFLVFFILSFL